MKKLLAIIILGLLFSGNVYAGLFGSSNIIKFTECYEIPKYNNYKSYKKSTDNSYDEWSLEIDLNKNTVTLSTIWDDKSMKRFKQKGYNIPRTEIISKPIKVSTSDFVVFNSIPDTEIILNLQNGKYQVNNKKANIVEERQCKTK